MGTAWRICRQHGDALALFAAACLASIYKPERCREFIRGKHSLRLMYTSEQAEKWFKAKLTNQLSKKVARRAIKSMMVEGYYAVKKKFAPKAPKAGSTSHPDLQAREASQGSQASAPA